MLKVRDFVEARIYDDEEAVIKEKPLQTRRGFLGIV
jgi:hypothetical protein